MSNGFKPSNEGQLVGMSAWLPSDIKPAESFFNMDRSGPTEMDSVVAWLQQATPEQRSLLMMHLVMKAAEDNDIEEETK